MSALVEAELGSEPKHTRPLRDCVCVSSVTDDYDYCSVHCTQPIMLIITIIIISSTCFRFQYTVLPNALGIWHE